MTDKCFRTSFPIKVHVFLPLFVWRNTEKERTYEGVAMIQSVRRIGWQDTTYLERKCPWYQRLRKWTKASKAVVLVNAPFAAFADLIVLIPRVCVLLVQAKFSAETTPLSLLDVQRELLKMGHPESGLRQRASKEELDHARRSMCLE